MLIKIVKLSWFSSLLTLFLLTGLFGQQKYNFEHISIPKGLSNPCVWDIVQDKHGFLWFSSRDGLNRYDGYSFKIFKNDPGNPHSLANDFIYSLLIDNDGVLWVGTNGGLSRYNRADDSFTNFLLDSIRTNSQANIIISMIQDKKGVIWIGTADGVVKYYKDKNKFEKISIVEGSNRISSSATSAAILETSSGEIYSAYLYKGLIKYNKATNVFEWINVDYKNQDIFKYNLILDLCEDKNGTIWISSQRGLFSYNPKNKIFNKIKLNDLTISSDNAFDGVLGLLPDDNFIWVGSGTNGIFKYNIETGAIIHIGKEELPGSINMNDGFFRIFKDSFGIIWISTLNNGLLKLDYQKEPFRLFANPTENINSNNHHTIYSVFKEPGDKDFVWLGTDDGLLKFNLKLNNYSKIKINTINNNSVLNKGIFDIQSGLNDNLWLGTSNGLSKMRLSDNTFTNYDFSDKSNKYGIIFNDIKNISKDDKGNLWIASEQKGVVKFNTANQNTQFIPTINYRTYDLGLINFIDSINIHSKAVAKLTKVGDYKDLSKEFILTEKTDVMIVSAGEGFESVGMVDYGWIINSKSENIWAQNDYKKTFYLGGSSKNRIAIKILTLDKGKYTLRYFSDDSHSYGSWNAPPPVDSALWGIQVFDLSSVDVKYYKELIAASENKLFINGDYISVLQYQNDETLLLGTTTGLFKYDIRKNFIESLFKEDKKFTSNLKVIRDIYIDEDKNVWIATNGGLIKYSQQSNSFNILDDNHGLPSNYIMAIEEDEYGNLWLSTMNGISKFNKDIKNPIFINYDVRDGLQGYTFNSRASFKSKDGYLFFAGQNGFNAFHSSNINKQAPEINITQLRISNQIVTPSSENSPLTSSIIETKNLELPYSQNNVSFEFCAIHYSMPEKNQYAYKLDGFDKEWIYDNRRFASYTNLQPGEYVFRVKGSNGDGIWNEAGTAIKIKVLPPWFRTIWAYTGYFLIFVGIVFGVDRIQRRRLLVKEREKQKIQNAELRAQIAEAESARKTKELEEARQLQLSMLPKQLPQLPHIDIAVYMKTATEVGGDYYDFHVHPDGTLTVILGDATGHGMMSGMMVSIMKSLFMSDRTNKELKPFFQNASSAIKDMQLGRLMMALTCVQIKNNRIITTNAGMPPLIIYRNNNQSVEEIAINNMPLGAMRGIDYDVKEFEIERGDTLLLMSDGFAELQNEEDESYGYKRAKNSFEKVAAGEPEEIVSYLNQESLQWSNSTDVKDDVTFVVIKIK